MSAYAHLPIDPNVHCTGALLEAQVRIQGEVLKIEIMSASAHLPIDSHVQFLCWSFGGFQNPENSLFKDVTQSKR